MLIGAHQSIAGGIHKAFARGEKVGCTTMQIFTQNNMQWRGAPLAEDDVEMFFREQKRSKIAPVISHTKYLLNCASPNPVIFEKSLAALMEEFRRAVTLGIPYVVMHPGNYLTSSPRKGIEQIARSLDRCFAEFKANAVAVALETTAGAGTSIGHTFEELARIRSQSKFPERIFACFDTAHAFAAGYCINTPRGYEKTMKDFDTIVGLDRIRVIHMNDSVKDCGWRVDRHAHIGYGFIGLEGFSCIMNDARFAHIPKILETPKGTFKGENWDAINILALKKLVKKGS